MKVLNMDEHRDGSATVELEIENGEKELLIEAGFIKVLEDYIQQREEDKWNRK